MPIYQFDCTKCGETADELMKYEDRHESVTCSCGEEMNYNFPTPAMVITGDYKRPTPPDVGPMSKKSRAYQKKKDDENSKFYRPDQTFGSGGSKGFKERQIKQKQMKSGKTNFSK